MSVTALALGMVVLMVTVAAVPIVIGAHRGRTEFISVRNGFVAYYVLQLGVSGAVTLLTRAPSELGSDPILHSVFYLRALELSLLGLIMLQIGYALARHLVVRPPSLVLVAWEWRRAPAVIFLLFIAGYTGFFLLMMRNGGLSMFLQNREAFRSGGIEGQGFLLFPATSLLTIAALIYVIVEAQNPRPSGIRVCIVTLIAVGPALLIGFRSNVVFPIMQVVVAWHFTVRSLSARRATLVALTLGIFFTGYGIYREIPSGIPTGRRLEIAQLAIEQNPRVLAGLVTRSAGAEVVARLIEEMKPSEKKLFAPMVVEAVTIPIPRIIWPGKPEPLVVAFGTRFFGATLAQSRQSEQEKWGGISPTIIGELYWHGATLGIVVGMLLIGVAFRSFDDTFQSYRGSPGVVLVYTFFFSMMVFMSESLQGPLNGLVLFSFALALVLPLLSLRVGRSSDPVHEDGDSGIGKAPVRVDVS